MKASGFLKFSLDVKETFHLQLKKPVWRTSSFLFLVFVSCLLSDMKGEEENEMEEEYVKKSMYVEMQWSSHLSFSTTVFMLASSSPLLFEEV